MPMPYYPNKNSSPFVALLAIILICLMSIIGPRYIQPIFNNLSPQAKILEFKNIFEKVSHPKNTSSLSLKTYYGSFTGNDIGCDFFVGEIRSFEGDHEIIRTSYQNTNVDRYPIELLFLTFRQLPNEISSFFPPQLHEIGDWELPEDADDQKLYLIYILIRDYQGEFDLDCTPKE